MRFGVGKYWKSPKITPINTTETRFIRQPMISNNYLNLITIKIPAAN